MVSNTGKKTGFSASRPLNLPRAIHVLGSPENLPYQIGREPHNYRVEKIQDMWRIDDEWWREESLSRMYYQCLLKNSEIVVVFQDLLTNQWYQQSE